MRIGLGIGIPQFQGNGSSGIAASGGTVLLEEATDSMQLEELPDRLIQEIT